jgi:glycosyltransferase involved in cell wall biosynthesis
VRLHGTVTVKISVISVGNPLDMSRWSGSANSICSTLFERSDSVSIIKASLINLIARLINRLLGILGQDIDVRHSILFARIGSLYCSWILSRSRPDVIVAIAASPFVAFLNSDAPIAYVSDATFTSIQRLYPRYAAFPRWLKRDGDQVEALALARSTTLIYPSHWAGDSAREDYGIAGSKIVIAPFGANLPAPLLAKRPAAKQLPGTGPLRILYISVDWVRKRGDLVIETARLLNQRGIPAKAVLVGNVPENITSNEETEVVGFLHKSNPAELHSLISEFENAHLFMLPTIADCFGTVFSEAQAFGCPSLTYDVGGTSGAVIDGQLGWLLKLGAPAEDFADRIEAMVADPAAYSTLSSTCRLHYETAANWSVFVDMVLRDVSGRKDAPGSKA